jgi:hypothetical protein
MADIPAKAGIGHPAMRFVSKTTARDMVSQLGSFDELRPLTGRTNRDAAMSAFRIEMTDFGKSGEHTLRIGRF